LSTIQIIFSFKKKIYCPKQHSYKLDDVIDVAGIENKEAKTRFSLSSECNYFNSNSRNEWKKP